MPAPRNDMRQGVLSEAAHRCLDELDLMDGLRDAVTAHRRGLAKLAGIAEPGLRPEAMANYLTHAAAFLIRAAELLVEPAVDIETLAGVAGGDAGSDLSQHPMAQPATAAAKRADQEPVAPPAEPPAAPGTRGEPIGEEDQD